MSKMLISQNQFYQKDNLFEIKTNNLLNLILNQDGILKIVGHFFNKSTFL